MDWICELDPVERERYLRMDSLIHLRSHLNKRGLSCHLLALDIRSSTAPHNEDNVGDMYSVVRTVGLVQSEEIERKVWKQYAIFAKHHPEKTPDISWTSFDISDATHVSSPVNGFFHHKDNEVRKFVQTMVDTNAQNIPDRRATGFLRRSAFRRNEDGINYVFSTQCKPLEREVILNVFHNSHIKGNIDLPLSMASPTRCPQERGKGMYCCLISKEMSIDDVICDHMGRWNGTGMREDGMGTKRYSSRTEKHDYTLTQDNSAFVKIPGSEDFKLHIYRAKLPAMPRLQKTIYTLLDADQNILTHHLLVWNFDAEMADADDFPEPTPHGNAKYKEVIYCRANTAHLAKAAELLKDRTLSIASCQALLSVKGIILSYEALRNVARKVRGSAGTFNSKKDQTDPKLVENLEAPPGWLIKKFDSHPKNDEKVLNLVAVDLRLLKVAASCQPTAEEMQKRLQELNDIMDDPEKYANFKKTINEKEHDESGYWRKSGGGWALDTTFCISDYVITALVAELPHIRTNNRESKRAWIPVGFFAHKHRDADVLMDGFTYMAQMIRTEIDGKKKCAAFLLTDNEPALYESMMSTPMFKHAVHGLCDFHLLKNFRDSGLKDPEGGGPIKKRLERHSATSAALFGIHATYPLDMDDVNRHFTPGSLWARTFEIFMDNIKKKKDKMDRRDFAYCMKHAEKIYDKHGSRFRLFSGRENMFQTTNPIEGFFKRLKEQIGSSRRSLDILFKQMYKHFTDIYTGIVIAVTEGGASANVKLMGACYPIRAMDISEARRHVAKYGIPDELVGSDNFANPLPEQFMQVVPKRSRVDFVKSIENHWTAAPVGSNQLLIYTDFDKPDTHRLKLTAKKELICLAKECHQRICRHIVISLALFPTVWGDREEAVYANQKKYFNSDVMYKNANRRAHGEKPHRAFGLRSQNNRILTTAGPLPAELIENPQPLRRPDDTFSSLDSSLNTTSSMENNADILDNKTFKVPRKRSSSVLSDLSTTAQANFPVVRRSSREPKARDKYSPTPTSNSREASTRSSRERSAGFEAPDVYEEHHHWDNL